MELNVLYNLIALLKIQKISTNIQKSKANRKLNEK